MHTSTACSENQSTAPPFGSTALIKLQQPEEPFTSPPADPRARPTPSTTRHTQRRPGGLQNTGVGRRVSDAVRRITGSQEIMHCRWRRFPAAPIECSASARTEAVTPVPQLAMMGLRSGNALQSGRHPSAATCRTRQLGHQMAIRLCSLCRSQVEASARENLPQLIRRLQLPCAAHAQTQSARQRQTKSSTKNRLCEWR